MEGLLQAIVVPDLCPDLLPLGLTEEFILTVSPTEPVLEKVGTTALQQCFSSLHNHLESVLKIRFLSLPLNLLHQYHQSKVLEISHFKKHPSNSSQQVSITVL